MQCLPIKDTLEPYPERNIIQHLVFLQEASLSYPYWTGDWNNMQIWKSPGAKIITFPGHTHLSQVQEGAWGCMHVQIIMGINWSGRLREFDYLRKKDSGPPHLPFIVICWNAVLTLSMSEELHHCTAIDDQWCIKGFNRIQYTKDQRYSRDQAAATDIRRLKQAHPLKAYSYLHPS